MVLFRAADVHLITGFIPSKFKYDGWFQSKLTAVQGFNELYIYNKFYQSMSTMSDPVVDYSHVINPYYIIKNVNQSPIKLLLLIFSLIFYHNMSYRFLIAPPY